MSSCDSSHLGIFDPAGLSLSSSAVTYTQSALPYRLVVRIRFTSPWRSGLGLTENASVNPFAD